MAEWLNAIVLKTAYESVPTQKYIIVIVNEINNFVMIEQLEKILEQRTLVKEFDGPIADEKVYD